MDVSPVQSHKEIVKKFFTISDYAFIGSAKAHIGTYGN